MNIIKLFSYIHHFQQSKEVYITAQFGRLSATQKML
jgi:hypothetical protein